MEMLRWLVVLVSVVALMMGGAARSAAWQKKGAPKAAQAVQIDINNASVEQLKALPGIGDVYAKKIVDGRPYKMKNQLVTKNVLSQAQYDKIKGSIVAKQ
jgi:competence protein ComEA